MNQQWDAPPADGDYSHYVERLNEQQAEGTPQPAPAVTLEQVQQARNVLRLVYVFAGAILLAPIVMSLWRAWHFLHEFGPLPAVLTIITGAAVPLAFFIFIARALRQHTPDIAAKMLDYPHFVERFNEQQPAPTVVTLPRGALLLICIVVGAILLAPVAMSLLDAWQYLLAFGPLPAVLIIVTGVIIPLIVLVFIIRVLRQRAPDIAAKMLERNTPNGPPET